MKIDTTFVCMRSSDHLGDAKNVEKRDLASSSLAFLRIAVDESVFRRVKEEGQIYKMLPQFFKFLHGDYMFFQSLVIILPRFFELERP